MELKVVRAVEDLGMIKGATGPHIMRCTDGRTYVVKFAGRDKTAVNELVGWALAKVIGLPVPDASLVDVSMDIITGSTGLTNAGVAPGLHLGSQLLPDALDMGQFMRKIQQTALVLDNEELIPRTVCHDNWILTTDRERDDNHLFHPADGVFRYAMVDFSHGFTGSKWTADTIEQGTYVRTIVPAHPMVANMVTGILSFEPTLEKLDSVEDSQVEEALALVPKRWGLTDEERVCLLEFLLLRRGLVKSIIISGRETFPNWQD